MKPLLPVDSGRQRLSVDTQPAIFARPLLLSVLRTAGARKEIVGPVPVLPVGTMFSGSSPVGLGCRESIPAMTDVGSSRLPQQRTDARSAPLTISMTTAVIVRTAAVGRPESAVFGVLLSITKWGEYTSCRVQVNPLFNSRLTLSYRFHNIDLYRIE